MLSQHLSIESSSARLQIRGGSARVAIRTPAVQLSIDQAQPPLRINSSPINLEIDYKASRASQGYYSMLALVGQIVSHSQSERAAGIADIVAKGDFLADAARHKNGVAAWSARHSLQPGDKQFNVGLSPGVLPTIDITPSNLSRTLGYSAPRIQIAARQPIIDVTTRENEISVIPPSLRIFVEGYGS